MENVFQPLKDHPYHQMPTLELKFLVQNCLAAAHIVKDYDEQVNYLIQARDANVIISHREREAKAYKELAYFD